MFILMFGHVVHKQPLSLCQRNILISSDWLNTSMEIIFLSSDLGCVFQAGAAGGAMAGTMATSDGHRYCQTLLGNSTNSLLKQIFFFLLNSIFIFRPSTGIPVLHSGSHFRHGLLQLMIHTIDPLHDGSSNFGSYLLIDLENFCDSISIVFFPTFNKQAHVTPESNRTQFLTQI